jgi:hypothetical protein
MKSSSMRSRLVLIPALVSSVFLAVGCGSSKPGNKDAYQEGSENCSYQFVSDHNTVASAFRMAWKKSDLERIESLVNDFERKYDSVSCIAGANDPSKLDSRKERINVKEKVALWKAAIAQERGETLPTVESAPTPKEVPAPVVSQQEVKSASVPACSLGFLSEARSVLRRLQVMKTYADFSSFEREVARFDSSYGTTVCLASSERGEETIKGASLVKEWKDLIAKIRGEDTPAEKKSSETIETLEEETPENE